MSGARTFVHAFAIVGVAEERIGNPAGWITVKKIVYAKEVAEALVAKYNAKGDGRSYFWQATSLEPTIGA